MCYAIGFLVKKTKKMTVLAGEKDSDGESIRFLMTIPTSLIRSITPLTDKT